MPTPQRQVAVITLGVGDLARSRRFYGEGFGWEPAFENDEIVFYQMNGWSSALGSRPALAADMRRPTPSPGGGGAIALAHNVAAQGEVQPLLDRLARPAAPCCGRATRRRTAGSAAMSPTRTGTPGRSRGTRRGRSARKAT